MTPPDDIAAVEAALAILNENGFDIASTRDGDLDDLEQERFNAVADACRAYLSAAQEGREAVAWRVKDYADGWIIHQNEGVAKAAASGMGTRLEPLYPTPTQPAAQVVEALRECLKRLEAEHGGYDPQDIRCSTCRAISHGHASLSALASPADADAAVGIRWYLGSMNDGLFIIDQPPSPSGADVGPHVKANGPKLILNVTDLPGEKAQAIVDAHNAALTAAKAGEDGR